MPNNVAEYKGVKSNSTYTVTTENGRAYLGVTGERPYDTSVLGVKLALSKFWHGSAVIDWGKVL